MGTCKKIIYIIIYLTNQTTVTTALHASDWAQSHSTGGDA